MPDPKPMASGSEVFGWQTLRIKGKAMYSTRTVWEMIVGGNAVAFELEMFCG
jgi:hypothetical protein